MSRTILLVSGFILIISGFELIPYGGIIPKTYCEPRYMCGDINHTVCQFGCRIRKTCLNFYSVFNNDTDRQAFLDIHNYFRNRIAIGNESSKGFGTAANMELMNWNHDSEFITYCSVKRCEYRQDECITPPDFEDAEQNIWQVHVQHLAMDEHSPVYIRDAVLSWYGEIKNFNDVTKRVRKFRLAGANHIKCFSKMIWATSNTLGCSRGTFHDGVGGMYMLIFCNYAPGGIGDGMSVYKAGTPQSDCPGDVSPSTEYKGLCGNLTLLSSTRMFRDGLPKNSATPSAKKCLIKMIYIVVLIVIS